MYTSRYILNQIKSYLNQSTIHSTRPDTPDTTVILMFSFAIYTFPPKREIYLNIKYPNYCPATYTHTHSHSHTWYFKRKIGEYIFFKYKSHVWPAQHHRIHF